jgi:hypothetical protein
LVEAQQLESVMALVQRDYILRMIEAIAAALARIVRRREAGDFAGARRETRVATIELLGPATSLAGSVDSRTAGDLLGDPWRLVAWARLVADDAETVRLLGNEEGSRQLERRALELFVESKLRGAELDAAAQETLRGLRVRVPAGQLDPRYHEAVVGDVAGH